MHLVLYGDSGSGKSWLYKRVLEEKGIPYLIANVANASRLGSLTAELKNVVDRADGAKQTGYSERKHIEGDAVVAKGGLSHEKHFVLRDLEPVEAAFAFLQAQANGEPAVLVFDNLESGFDHESLMKELADVIILLDDPRYAQYQIQLLIVGVPSGVREYFARTPTRRSVANRLQELPEVARLSRKQVDTLVRRGFVDELEYSVNEPYLIRVSEHVAWVTGGVPLHVHEYCLGLAYLTEYDGTLTPDDLEPADGMWLSGSMADCYEAIEAAMNRREAKVGRRNQTLYALGRTRRSQFRSPDVERVVRKEFPHSTRGKNLSVAGILSDLARRDPPILRRSPRDQAYQFSDPRYVLALRAMLRKTGEAVRQVEMDSYAES